MSTSLGWTSWPRAVPCEACSPGGTRWQRDALFIALGLLVLCAWDASGADLTVMQWIGSPGGFALRGHWLTDRVLHTGGQWASVAVWLGCLINVFRPLPGALSRLHVEQRFVRVGMLLGMVSSLLLVSALKRHSLTSCPWDAQAFGGVATQVSHWAWAEADGGPGRCFPSGHAARAFSLLAVWFPLRSTAPPHVARRWLTGVLLAGLLLGGAQVLRGAHYPSHVGWTAWTCWVVAAAVWHGMAACFSRP